MRIIKKLLLTFIFIAGFGHPAWAAATPVNFATATDTEHYKWTLNLIAGIQRFHSSELGGIAVFDLGLTPEERGTLNSLAFVQVYDVEQTNPDMFKKFSVNKQGKIARGWYSWKPVVIKQAMELFPVFFYLDSGISLTGPLDLWFNEVDEKGYFFIDCGHSIGRMTPKPLIEKFQLNSPDNQWILKAKGISSGIQGLSRKVYTNYVLPCFALSSDIANFQDDGSCPKGFGWARHDQTIFSIQARLNDFEVHEVINGGKFVFNVDGQPTLFSLSDFILITRGNFDLDKSKQYLRYK